MEPTEDRHLRRLVATLHVLIERCESGLERELVSTVVQAVAIWYDLDVRAYRRDLQGRYVLDVWLSGADLVMGPKEFGADALRAGTDIVRISSIAEQEQLGWHNVPGELVLLPVAPRPKAAASWALAIPNLGEARVSPAILVLCRVLGVLIEQLAVQTAADLRERIMQRLAERDEPLAELAQAALEELARTSAATQVRLMLRRDEAAAAQQVAAVGPELTDTAPDVAVGQPLLSPQRMVFAMRVGAQGLALLDVRSAAEGGFTVSHARLTETAALLLSLWLTGARQGTRALPVEPGKPAASAFERRIEEEVTRAQRFHLPLGLVLIELVPLEQAREAAVPRAVARQFRESDLVGRLATGEVATMLVHTGAQGVAAVATRLRQTLEDVARQHGLTRPRVGQAVFPDDATSAGELVARASQDLAEGGQAES